MPENFDSHEVSKRRRRDGDEGLDAGCYSPACCTWCPAAGWQCLKRANKRGARAPQAQSFQGLQHTSLVSFHSQTEGSGNFGYSVSGVQFFGLTVLCAGHQPQLADGLQAMQQGGIDRLARLFVGGGLNSNQINHLQQSASETHYRGQRRRADRSRPSRAWRCRAMAHGR